MKRCPRRSGGSTGTPHRAHPRHGHLGRSHRHAPKEHGTSLSPAGRSASASLRARLPTRRRHALPSPWERFGRYGRRGLGFPRPFPPDPAAFETPWNHARPPAQDGFITGEAWRPRQGWWPGLLGVHLKTEELASRVDEGNPQPHEVMCFQLFNKFRDNSRSVP